MDFKRTHNFACKAQLALLSKLLSHMSAKLPSPTRIMHNYESEGTCTRTKCISTSMYPYNTVLY